MNNDFIKALDELEKSKKIPREVVFDALEKALIKSYEKNFDYQDNENEESSVEVNINRDNGKVNLYAIKTVVENVEDKNTEISLEEAKAIKHKYDLGDKIKIEITPKNFGRIAAQTARNIVIQKLKDAERDNIYNEFIDREKEIITGTVQRVERGIVYIDLGRVEGIIPVSEQIKTEEYIPNKRLKLFIKEVKNTTKGAQIILSRTDNSLIKRLFELEVPEINDGTVEIFSVAREPGSRTKIAVFSNDENVDPVGSCVGFSGTRVKSIVDELNGEKLDIVIWSKDIKTFISNSLSPSEVIATFIDEAQKICRVIVSEDQLSLAIGKEGQNARLAAKLTNWKIDIKGLNQYLEAYDDGILSVEFDGEADFLEANGIEVRAEDKDKIFEKIKYHESDDKEEEMDDIKDDNSLVSDNNEIAEDSEN
ncbi:transcription termination/antitermination protein NusA [Finegoldia magna]|uniref:Transcription termination/antitermination protein NusA n=1 Tax=Finegoldia magna TaxID=1260 RepID=A0A233W1I3_FINMA|nr:transcription termination factor NusA [Finegoldia magna]OXZ38515.1 transcription termination/antitermination protein NusA [Finegoldia magna]